MNDLFLPSKRPLLISKQLIASLTNRRAYFYCDRLGKCAQSKGIRVVDFWGAGEVLKGWEVDGARTEKGRQGHPKEREGEREEGRRGGGEDGTGEYVLCQQRDCQAIQAIIINIPSILLINQFYQFYTPHQPVLSVLFSSLTSSISSILLINQFY